MVAKIITQYIQKIWGSIVLGEDLRNGTSIERTGSTVEKKSNRMNNAA